MRQNRAALAFSDLDFESLGLSMLNNAVAAVRVESTWGPPIYIPSPFSSGSKAGGSAAAGKGGDAAVIAGQGFDAGRLLRPKVTLVMKKGWGKDLAFAPYGNPGTSQWGWVVGAGFAVLILAAVGGYTLARARG